jgi:hypothetical protein
LINKQTNKRKPKIIIKGTPTVDKPILHYPQIDFVKTLAITSVILLHSLPAYILLDTYSAFHISQAIPTFIIITGLVWYLSFNKATKHTLKESYNRLYFKKKIKRFIIPFLIIYLIDLVYLLAVNFTITTQGIIRILTFQLPTGAPGSFYTSLIIQIILISPIIFYCYQKKPNLTLVGLFAIDLSFELIAPVLPYWVYYISSLRYLAAFAIGIFLSKIFIKNTTRFYRTRSFLVICILGIASSIYMLLFMRQLTPLFRAEWETQNLLSFFYPSLLVTIILLVYPFFAKFPNIQDRLNIIGKASYHIFLIQLIYFGIGGNQVFLLTTATLPVMGIVSITANLIITFALGLIFYYIDKRSYGYNRLRFLFNHIKT